MAGVVGEDFFDDLHDGLALEDVGVGAVREEAESGLDDEPVACQPAVAAKKLGSGDVAVKGAQGGAALRGEQLQQGGLADEEYRHGPGQAAAQHGPDRCAVGQGGLAGECIEALEGAGRGNGQLPLLIVRFIVPMQGEADPVGIRAAPPHFPEPVDRLPGESWAAFTSRLEGMLLHLPSRSVVSVISREAEL